MFVATPSPTVSLAFHSHPSVVLVLGAAATFFWWAFGRLGPTLVPTGQEIYSSRQRNWVIAGLGFAFVWSYWPLHDIAEKYLFLVHMTQHTVFTFVSPACLLMGSPPWLWRWFLTHRGPAAVVRFMSQPLVALVVFNTLIVVTHYRPVVETSLHNEWFHFGVHVTLFGAATMIWIPVINRVEGLPRLKAPAKMAFLFAQSIVPTVPASFLTFATRPMYPTYAAAPRMIHGIDAIGDQQIAAAIMKVGAGAFLWGVVAALFAAWYRDTLAGRADDNVLTEGHEWQRQPREAAPRPQIAGMKLSGAWVGAEPAAPALPAAEVLTWAEVQAEFARIDQRTVLTEEGEPER